MLEKYTKKVFYYVNSQGTKYYLNKDKFEIDGEVDNYYFFTKEVRNTACEKPDKFGIGENDEFTPHLNNDLTFVGNDYGHSFEEVDDFYKNGK
jgi:hypothetical protein